VRVGITTGEAVVSLDARPELGEGIVTGDVVNTAARLQAVAPVGVVVVGEPTFRATRRVFDYRALEPVRVKGKADPVATWSPSSSRTAGSGRSGGVGAARHPRGGGRDLHWADLALLAFTGHLVGSASGAARFGSRARPRAARTGAVPGPPRPCRSGPAAGRGARGVRPPRRAMVGRRDRQVAPAGTAQVATPAAANGATTPWNAEPVIGPTCHRRTLEPLRSRAPSGDPGPGGGQASATGRKRRLVPATMIGTAPTATVGCGTAASPRAAPERTPAGHRSWEELAP
jgi:Adenylate and Guanylate cyclase catalytic domain